MNTDATPVQTSAPPAAAVVVTTPGLPRLTRDGITIYKRYTSPGAVYYHTCKVQGKTHMISLCETAEESFRIVRGFRRELKAGRFAILDAIKQRRTTSALAEIFTRYEERAQAAAGTSPASLAQTANAVRNILRQVRLPEPPLPPGATAQGKALQLLQNRLRRATLPDEQIGTLPASVLNAELLEDYKRLELLRAGDDKIALGRAAITANSNIRQARALFSHKLPADFYAGLALPDVAALRAVRLLPEPDKRFRMPAPAVIERIRADAKLLKQLDPNCYMIYLLAFGCGLRSGEIKYGRQHWIETGIDGRSVLHIQLEADFDIKDHQSRMVPLEDIILTELRELMPATERGKPDYILSGNATERTDQAFRRFAVWIKKCGLDRIKAAYELRKVYGSLVTQQAGLRAAQELLGHSSYHTTESYYVDQVELPRITIFGKP